MRIVVKWFIILFCVTLIIGLIYYAGRQLELSSEPVGVDRGNLAVRFSNNRVVEYSGKKYTYNPTLTSILLIGTDNESGKVALHSFRSGGQADFLMLLVLDSQNKTFTSIQIDRDCMTQLTVLGVLGNVTGTRMAQICLAHSFGSDGHESCKLTVQAVKNLLGDIDIDLYAAFNPDAIAVLNDWLGGVSVTITDDFSSVDPTMVKGSTMKLSAQQAEYFVRSRVNVGSGTNTDRMIRQRQYLEEINNLLQKRIKEDKNALGSLFNLFSTQVVTNMSRGRLINETDRAYSYKMGNIISLKGEHTLGVDGFTEFHADQGALTQLVLSVFYIPVE